MLANEVLSFIEENDVKFIRLAFTDLFGRLRSHRCHRRSRMRGRPGRQPAAVSRSGYAVHFALAAPVRAGMPAVMRPGYAAGRFLFHGQPRAS